MTPYRPQSGEVTSGLTGRLRRCRRLLTDPATWRDLLWTLVGVPARVVLGLTPAFLLFLGGWAWVADAGTLLYGWWNAAPPGATYQVIFLSMLPLGIIGVVAGPRLLKAHAQIASSLLVRPGRRWRRRWAG